MKRFCFLIIMIFCCMLAAAQPTNVGLIGYWPMDGNFNDAGPYAVHGTNSGATATTNIAAVANKAMQFLNPSADIKTVAQWATIPINSNFNFTGNQDFTIAFYVFTNSPYIHPGGFYDNNVNYGGPGVFFWNNPTTRVQFNYKSASINSMPGTFPLGQWVHVAAVRAGGTLKLYINGILNNTGAEGPTAPAYAYPARLGTMFYVSYPLYNGLNGKMDELRIYNRALSDIEILNVLPVRMISFTAQKSNDNVLLKWQTASEQNTNYFNVQRSTDGTNFTNIGRITAAGNSVDTKTYYYTDKAVNTLTGATNVFYRVETVDVDDTKLASEMVSVKIEHSKKDLFVLQNPVHNELQLQLITAEKGACIIQLLDLSGKPVLNKSLLLNGVLLSTTINVAGLNSGIYLLVIKYGDKKETQRIVKQ